MALVGTREINDIEVEVHASPTGGWAIRTPGVEGAEGFLGSDPELLDKAVNKARLEIKKRQVEIALPFKTQDGKRGIARGRRAGSTDKILVTIGGTKDSLSSYTNVLKHETPKEVVEHLQELVEEERRIGREKREIMNKWEFKLGVAVDAAVKEAAEEAINA